MRVANLVRSILLAALLSAVTFYPFLPGDADAVAPMMSMTAQFFILGGALFLLPSGLWWLGLRAARQRVQGSLTSTVRASRVLLLLGLAAVGLLSALGAWIGGSPLMGIAVLSVSGIVPWRLRKRIDEPIDSQRATAEMAAYLVVVPVAGLLMHFALVGPMTDFSRNRAMDRAEILLAGIDRHYSAKGVYPDSLVALWPDFRPGIVGIPQYHYARHGSAYTLSFRQPSVVFPGFGREEVVVYNPRDEHLFPSHAAWALDWPMEQRMARQGWRVSLETGRKHWKYFWFD